MKIENILKNINLSERLDIIVKILYIESIEKNLDKDFFKNLYLKHIKIQTGFIEDNKNTSIDFINCFNNLINNIKTKGFNKDYSVEIWANLLPLSWAHRIACCIYFKKNIYIKKNSQENWITWNINWFVKHKFTNNEILSILKKYKELSWDTIWILWPTCKTDKLLWESIRYKMDFPSAYFMKENVLDIYSYDNLLISDIWITNKANITSEFKYFHILLLNKKFKKDSIRNILISNINDKRLRNEEKQYFTVHTAEDFYENEYLENVVLLRKYYFHLFLRKWSPSKNLLRLLKNIKSIYTKNMCIVWSSPLGIYNIFRVSDIDIIETQPKNTGIKKIKNEIDILDYHYSKKYSNQEIINSYYFYYRGFKFLDLEKLCETKSQWLRKKDSEQYIALKKYLSNHVVLEEHKYNVFEKINFIKTRVLINIINIWIQITKKIWMYRTLSYCWRKYILKKFR